MLVKLKGFLPLKIFFLRNLILRFFLKKLTLPLDDQLKAQYFTHIKPQIFVS